jgi:hypothetical protein
LLISGESRDIDTHDLAKSANEHVVLLQSPSVGTGLRVRWLVVMTGRRYCPVVEDVVGEPRPPSSTRIVTY